MPEKKRRSPTRLLAPIALIVFAVTLLLVLGGSGSDGGDDAGGGAGTGPAVPTTAETTTETTPEQPEKPRKRNYIVKAGDNLDLIAEKTGVPVDTLQELNPEVDPQALVIGQTIKLRE